MEVAAPVAKLIEAFSRLPSIGPKTAQRLTFYLLRNPNNLATDLANALIDLRDKTMLCSTCFNLADMDPCHICRNQARDRSVVCVVEEPLDILAIERTGRIPRPVPRPARRHLSHGTCLSGRSQDS